MIRFDMEITLNNPLLSDLNQKKNLAFILTTPLNSLIFEIAFNFWLRSTGDFKLKILNGLQK